MRAFLALEPSIAVCERLVLLQEDLSDPIHHLDGEVAWRRGDQLRLLVRGFEIEPAQLRWVEGALAQALSPLRPIEFTVQGTRFVPSEECARFLVVGVEIATEDVDQLRAAIDPVLTSVGVAPAPQKWVPELVLGRLRTVDRHPRLGGIVRAFSETLHGTTTAGSAVLTTTELAGGRVRAKQSRRFVFTGDATSRPSAR
jgi:2'-5' RNA ligase